MLHLTGITQPAFGIIQFSHAVIEKNTNATQLIDI
jgi:hypothetical protein